MSNAWRYSSLCELSHPHLCRFGEGPVAEGAGRRALDRLHHHERLPRTGDRVLEHELDDPGHLRVDAFDGAGPRKGIVEVLHIPT